MSELEQTTMMQEEEAHAAEEMAAPNLNSNSNGGSSSVAMDPLRREPSPIVREGDSVILVFGDGRQIFAQCVRNWKGKLPPVKINKRSYPTANLIGLPYGTVLELERSRLAPLPATEDLVPEYPSAAVMSASQRPESNANNEDDDANNEVADTDADDTTFPTVAPQERERDNRHIVDNNTSQGMDLQEIARLREAGVQGSTIVDKVRVRLLTFTMHHIQPFVLSYVLLRYSRLSTNNTRLHFCTCCCCLPPQNKQLIENSATFDQKTDFSKAKYIARKQMKHQPRCRMVRCTPATVCEAVFMKDPRKVMNMREDTLGQILSHSNVGAGCRALIFETSLGVVTGAVAQRMGGYGKIFSIYSGQQPSFSDMIQKFNLSFGENNSIKYLHSGDVFGDATVPGDAKADDASDPEKADREILHWPCPLRAHTRNYLENMRTHAERVGFLSKRCARFARKLTRHTPAEAKEWVEQRPCDSLIIASCYDPTETLLGLLPYLAPSCPFVVYSEFVEPLTECFRELQRQDLAINLRVSDTWTREYQVLPGRTHPNMNMSQSGGFILTGTKLCPETGHNELDEELLKEIRVQIGGRRGKKNGRGKKKSTSPPPPDREAKRARKADS
jgi:tRNA (adenine-N(1)-)-methyltransferase non-catalytic subunit